MGEARGALASTSAAGPNHGLASRRAGRVIDGGLAPITEALIKILVLKAQQGALSEDKAFELLGTVRLL